MSLYPKGKPFHAGMMFLVKNMKSTDSELFFGMTGMYIYVSLSSNNIPFI